MTYSTIEREIQIQAAPATVFEVISNPEHLKRWWPDDADIEATPGATGELVFGDRSSPDAQIPQVTVMEAEPPRRFSFRWTHPKNEAARAGNSLLVVFELTANDGGTLLRMTESGFVEMGWEAGELEQAYEEHVRGWDHFLPRLVDYAPTAQVAS